jgi:hypothetical protein
MAFVYLVVSSLETPRAAQPKFISLFYGVIFAFALATKTTVIFLGVIPLLMLAGWQDRLAFIYTTAASYVLFSIPIAEKFMMMAQFLREITSAQENAGGPTGLAVLPLLLKWSPFFCAVFACSLLALATAWPRRRDAGIAAAYRALSATVLAQALTLALISRHPAPRYLIPVEVLCGVNLYALSRLIFEVPAARRLAAPPWRWAWLVMLCVAAFAEVGPFASRAVASRRSLDAATRLARYIKEKHPEDAVLYHEQGNSQANAFFFAIFRSDHGRFHKQAEAHLGRAFIYRYRTGQITSVEDDDRSADVLEAARRGALVVRVPAQFERDLGGIEAALPGIKLVKEMEFDGECVYASRP